MLPFEFYESPILPVSEYWGAYILIYIAFDFFLSVLERRRKRKARYLASYAFNICQHVCAAVLSSHRNEQNQDLISDIAFRLSMSLSRADKEYNQSDMELI